MDSLLRYNATPYTSRTGLEYALPCIFEQNNMTRLSKHYKNNEHCEGCERNEGYSIVTLVEQVVAVP